MDLPYRLEPMMGARVLDDTAGRIEGLLYSHFRGVEQGGVFRLDQRGCGAAAVAFVAAAVAKRSSPVPPPDV